MENLNLTKMCEKANHAHIAVRFIFLILTAWLIFMKTFGALDISWFLALLPAIVYYAIQLLIVWFVSTVLLAIKEFNK